jgi:hypothetical protein
MTRKEMVKKLLDLNPFAGRDYYENLTTKQLRETIERWEGTAK